MNKMKVLCLSFWTPPLVRPQSILIGKMIPEWISQGIDPVIMTYDVCGDWDIGIPIFKIPQFEVNKLIRVPVLGNILNLFKKRGYYSKLYKEAGKLIKEHDIKIIFSFANPQESNILGAMLAKRLGIKFVSHFSDPWYDNPYKTFSKLGGKKVLILEKFIIKNSDKVIFTNKTAQELVMKKYPSEWQKKALTIPHCYDLRDYPNTADNKPLSSKFILSYIGAFYKERNPELLFRALKNIIDRDKNFSDKFVIKLVGATNDYAGYSVKNIESMLNNYNLEGVAEIVPPISYRESLKFMKLSDCLIVIDADMPGSPFLPSKAVDYAGSGKVIIGITPTNSPTAQFLDGLGCGSFNYEEIDKLSSYLKRLISGEIKTDLNQEFLKQFDVKDTTARLIKEFNGVLKKIT